MTTLSISRVVKGNPEAGGLRNVILQGIHATLFSLCRLEKIFGGNCASIYLLICMTEYVNFSMRGTQLNIGQFQSRYSAIGQDV